MSTCRMSRPRLRRRDARSLAGVVLVAATVVACGSDTPTANTADRTFLEQMIPHHERAVAVARTAAERADDPRVRAFAARIVKEQTPELARLDKAAAGLRLDKARGARDARHRISDTEVSALLALRGGAFDRRFLQLNIDSETGAAEMARSELRSGELAAAKDVARPIATAPDTQIPELRALLAALGR